MRGVAKTRAQSSLLHIIGRGPARPRGNATAPCCVSNTFFRQRPLLQPTAALASWSLFGHAPRIGRQQERCYHNLHIAARLHPLSTSALLTQQQRQLSTRGRGKRNNKKKVDPNLPLLNEHLVAELFRLKKRESVTAETYEVRLVIDQGFSKKKPNGVDEEDADTEESDSSPQVVSLSKAMSMAHDLALDLMEVTLKADPPVLKAVDFDSWLYKQKRKEKEVSSKRRKEGGGAISDRQLKEFKFRAGIADHDLQRKATNMLKYLDKGHAVRVTLSARQRSLNADALAIETTLDRVKELVGDKAVEVRGMKANERKSYGSLLLHPNKSSKG